MLAPSVAEVEGGERAPEAHIPPVHPIFETLELRSRVWRVHVDEVERRPTSRERYLEPERAPFLVGNVGGVDGEGRAVGLRLKVLAPLEGLHTPKHRDARIAFPSGRASPRSAPRARLDGARFEEVRLDVSDVHLLQLGLLK